MKSKRRHFVTSAVALLSAVGLSLSLAAPAQADTIRKTYNAKTGVSFAYYDAENLFCLDPSNNVDAGSAAFYYPGSSESIGRFTPIGRDEGWICLNIRQRTGAGENVRIKFKLMGHKVTYEGGVSIGYLTT